MRNCPDDPVAGCATSDSAYGSLLDLLDCIVDGVHVIDSRGHSVMVNRAWENHTGIRSDEIVGLHVSEMVSQGLISHSAAAVSMKTGKQELTVEKVRNGSFVVVKSVPMELPGTRPVLYVCNVRHFPTYQDSSRARVFLEEPLFLDDAGAGEYVFCCSLEMNRLLDQIRRVARFTVPVLLEGETGAGKEMAANLIHRWSDRRGKPFIRVNCGAIPENLVESELFGYVPGAFTGASRLGKPGMFELAHGGTLLLDEVTEMPNQAQVKLLRVLQDGEVWRLGATSPTKVDVRILSASNKDVRQAVESKHFREDLYYRLNVVNIRVPALRERLEDLPQLVEHFVRIFCARHHLSKNLTPEVLDALLHYTWPGNIRELRNVIEQVMIISPADTITLNDLPPHIRLARGADPVVPKHTPLRTCLEALEERILRDAIKRYGSSRKASQALGIDHSTMARKIRRFNIMRQEKFSPR